MKTKKKSSIEVDKNIEIEDIKLSNKIINFYILEQIKDSNTWLRVLESQVKFLEESNYLKNLITVYLNFKRNKLMKNLKKLNKNYLNNTKILVKRFGFMSTF